MSADDMNRMMLAVTPEQYSDAVEKLMAVAIQDTGGSVAAAQLLLGLYNSHEFHVDLVDIACRFDEYNRHLAIVAIIGRGSLMHEPHEVIDNGGRRFERLWKQWESLHVEKRYAEFY